MTDRFIDKDETQIYGPYAARKIRSTCAGLIRAYDGALAHIAAEIDHATAAVGAALAASRTAGLGVRKGGAERKPALHVALDVLGRFSTHLDSHPKGAVDRKAFFPEDGTAAGVGRSSGRVLLALARILTELDKKSSSVKGKDEWTAEVKVAVAALSPVVDHADSAKTDQRESTPALEAARQGWLQIYVAAKDLVASVLRLTGKLDLMPSVFHDLAVPAHAKVTAPPDEPPVSGAAGAVPAR